ncbi:MAG: DUF1294 domain-containing protein [Erysipelotrichaceae bacterium]|nr:DUF1294 domain-containing protein [Erysipelotrichaceae bacterium]
MFYYLLFINIFAFLMFGLDKYRAIKKLWRTSEKTLFLLAMLGGAYGSLLGMYIFHHKTKKAIFNYGLPILCIIEMFVLAIISNSFNSLF